MSATEHLNRCELTTSNSISVGPEFFEIREEAARVINESRAQGGRVIAVGTTTTRALESAVNAEGMIEAGKQARLSLTITPGYKFRVTDALLTNFHLPRSSLLLLVSAFAGRDFTLEAYRYAVAAALSVLQLWRLYVCDLVIIKTMMVN